MLSMGMVPNNVSISVNQIEGVNGPSVQVTVANQFGLLCSQGLLPTQITLHNTVLAASGTND